jgi:hypothetical protein
VRHALSLTRLDHGATVTLRDGRRVVEVFPSDVAVKFPPGGCPLLADHEGSKVGDVLAVAARDGHLFAVADVTDEYSLLQLRLRRVPVSMGFDPLLTDRVAGRLVRRSILLREVSLLLSGEAARPGGHSV